MREPAVRNRGLSVLLVDDDAALAHAIEALLLLEGFTVFVAGSLLHARRVLAREPPSCVLLDHRLADGNAPELLDELVARDARVPVVLFSGAPAAIETARAYGIAHVPKPCDVDMLVAAIELAVTRSGYPIDAKRRRA